MSKKKKKAKKKIRQEKDVLRVIGLIISLLAIAIALASFIYQYKYQKLEYEYKIEPKFDITFETSIKKTLEDGVEKNEPFIETINVQIDEINNLQSVYVVHSDSKVDKLIVDAKIEEKIQDVIKQAVNVSDEDGITIENSKYKYMFLVFESLDDEYDVFTVFVGVDTFKRDEIGKIIIEVISEMEMYELEYSQRTDKEAPVFSKIVEDYKNLISWIKEETLSF